MSRRRRSRGFSLIEIMIAGTIFAVGAVAVLSGFSTLMNAVEHQRRLADAGLLAKSVVEELLSLPSGHPDISSGAGGHTRSYDRYGRELANGEFTTVWEVVNDSPANGFATISVLVEWTESRGTQRFRMTTVVGSE